MQQHHGWSMAELEEVYPYERDLYVDLLRDHLEEVKEKRRLVELQRRGAG